MVAQGFRADNEEARPSWARDPCAPATPVASSPPVMASERGTVRLQKIVSGGQSGVDRAALDTARILALPCGGWCPRGRRAEDGPIHPRYPLVETPAEDYAQRTEWNVRDADGTLVLTRGEPTQGTAFTVEVARRLLKPCLVLDLDRLPGDEPVRAWLEAHRIAVLNVAGPRESKCPGIYRDALVFLQHVLSD